jgi:hypothetical protein
MPLFLGKNVRRKGDQLTPVELPRVAQMIGAPSGKLFDFVSQLREVYSLDHKRYQSLKVELPYFIGASFYPAARHRENFVAIEYFTVDLDYFDALDAPDFAEVRRKLCSRNDVQLLFTSPGGYGLKVVFRLAEPCSEAGVYRLFYQRFLENLILQYGLEDVADTVTHDVSRVCFLSHDPEVFWNEGASPVKLQEFVDLEHPQLPDQIQRAVKNSREEKSPEATGPDDLTLEAIKRQLNPDYRPRKRVSAHTPERISRILPELEKLLLNHGIETLKSNPIQHGRQLRLGIGDYWAEVNIFFGKKGFSVVKTAKSGSQPDLAELVTRLLREYLITHT